MTSLADTGQYNLSALPHGYCITSVAASMAWQFPISLSLSLSLSVSQWSLEVVVEGGRKVGEFTRLSLYSQ